MTMRSTTARAQRTASSSIGRCTIREIDDDHLCQQVKQGDMGHSDTAEDFEMWHPLGITSVAMKQEEDKQQGGGQQGGQGGGGQGGGAGGGGNQWAKNQPQGESAEGIVNYIGGNREHPVAMVNDRRVRPYGLKPGEAALYSPKGSGQMVYHRERGDDKDGLYMLTCDDEGEQSGGGSGGGAATRAGEGGGSGGGGQKQERFVSCRHVKKKKQGRKKQQQQQGGGSGGGGGAGAGAQATQFAAGDSSGGGSSGGGGQQSKGELPDGSKSNYKHEGETVNVETRWMKDKIQYYDGEKPVGYYDKTKKDWLHHDGEGVTHSTRVDKNHTHQKFDGNHIWTNKNNCYSSKPLVIQPDNCSG